MMKEDVEEIIEKALDIYFKEYIGQLKDKIINLRYNIRY